MIDETYFYEFVERHKDMLWHVCSDYSLGQAWQIDDAFQEVLCSIWTGLPSLRKRENEKAWAYRVATNTMLMISRNQQNRPTDPLPDNLEHLIATDGDVLTNIDYNNLLQLINQLDEPDRRIVRMHLDGFNFKEIGRDLGISRDAAAQRFNRAIKKIRQSFQYA